jgi:DNA-binding CsgD family transcriptional regulator
MTMGQVERLTATQKACLRLVFLHMSSKDIGKQLGTSPHTVDNHIKAAMQRLGVENRRMAARLLAETEGLDFRRALTDQSPELGNDTSPNATVFAQFEEKFESGSAEFTEKVSVQTDTRSHYGQASVRLPIPRYLGEANTLSAAERIGWMLALVVLICLAVGAMLSGLEALRSIT